MLLTFYYYCLQNSCEGTIMDISNSQVNTNMPTKASQHLYSTFDKEKELGEERWVSLMPSVS